MKLLLLGGTRFLGRHIVDAALARGHDVTLFTRGRTALPWPDRVTALVGDRDPTIAPGLASLEHGTWDAVIDTSGYVPRIAGASASLLGDRVARYVFVSSVSVYARTDRPGISEVDAVATLSDSSTEDIPAHYGALKAACESTIARIFGTRATHVRPGLIVGPFDSTDRFGYWVARFVHPTLLGPRAPYAIVPAPRERPIQLIDARDLARWLVDVVENDVAGTFNAVSPAGQWTFGDLVHALGECSAAPPAPAWVDDATLELHAVTPWTGLPLWLPASEPDAGGFMSVDGTKALRAGLATRPLTQTVEDTAKWLIERDNASAWRSVVDGETERAIVADGRYATSARRDSPSTVENGVFRSQIRRDG